MSGTGITIRINGLPSYKKKLEALGEAVDKLDEPMAEARRIALAAVKSYPPYGNWEEGQISFSPTRPGSKYKRTGALGKGWRARVSKTNKMHKLLLWHSHPTSGRYFPYVQGDSQSSFHRPWWVTKEEWQVKLRPITLKIFQNYMKSLVVKFKLTP